jgi:SecD/SecF fusion protein
LKRSVKFSASLGSDSIKSGIYSGIAGFILVVVFMIIYYRTWSVLSPT